MAAQGWPGGRAPELPSLLGARLIRRVRSRDAGSPSRAGPWPQLACHSRPVGGVVGLGLRLLGGALRLDVVLLGSGRGDLRLDVGGVRVGRLGGRGRAGPPPSASVAASPDGTPAHRPGEHLVDYRAGEVVQHQHGVGRVEVTASW